VAHFKDAICRRSVIAFSSVAYCQCQTLSKLVLINNEIFTKFRINNSRHKTNLVNSSYSINSSYSLVEIISQIVNGC